MSPALLLRVSFLILILLVLSAFRSLSPSSQESVQPMDPATEVRQAWTQAGNPLDVFEVVTRLAPRPLGSDSSLVRALHETLSSPADRWIAERLLEGRLGVSSGLPAFDIDPAPIPVHFVRGTSSERVLVVAGVHGSEPQGIEAAHLLFQQLEEGPRPEVNVLVVPTLFPDNARVGPHGRREGTIPTNRNFPADGRALANTPTDASGWPLDARGRQILPENVLLMKTMERFQPRHIVSIHGTQYPRRAGIFSDPYRVSPALQEALRQHAASAAPQGMQNVSNAPSVAPGTLYDALLQRAVVEAERRTRTDERLAVAAAEKVAEHTDGLDELRRARRQTEQQQAASAHRPPDLSVIEAHPAVAGNRLGVESTAHWSGEVADGVSLGSYAPARGIGVFTVEPTINRASTDYPTALDPGVSPSVRHQELQAYATAIRIVLLQASVDDQDEG